MIQPFRREELYHENVEHPEAFFVENTSKTPMFNGSLSRNGFICLTCKFGILRQLTLGQFANCFRKFPNAALANYYGCNIVAITLDLMPYTVSLMKGCSGSSGTER